MSGVHFVWATGDAGLSRIGAINWEKKEYILEDTDEFINEITPSHRIIAIGDDEQLAAATSIGISWSNADTLLLLGPGNRNVLAWTKKGYAKKGAALILNQEPSRWIAKRRSRVDGVYVRSGRNFSPDWMTRAETSNVLEWAAKYGFARVRLRPRWGEMMADYRNLMSMEITMPESRSFRRDLQTLVCRLERNR